MLTCLLPVRNGAADLPGWLESVGQFADSVIALDDGSTDATAAILERSPLVAEVLRNPVRDSHSGWDDGANRRALHEAAVRHGGGWVLFLDADERIDAADGAALRELLAGDALEVCAYGLQLFREWGEGMVERSPAYVFRLFHAGPGQSLPAERLHFNPVPVQIPRTLWIRTTLRARHLDSPRRVAERVVKYETADPAGEFAPSGLRRLADPEDEIVAWTERPAGLAPLDLEAGLAPVLFDPERRDARLTVLLPARNAAADLPDWFRSVARFADDVIALDDGSTDETAAILEAHESVAELLRAPRREGYAGWDDAANRSRLLEAAIARGADWVLYLDADERIDRDDAAALRGFVERDARRGDAYSMRVYRMLGDLEHFDRSELWVTRMFAAEPGQSLNRARLHLVPVPEQIPRSRHRRTTIRIQHLGGIDPARRRARVAKYREADPGLRWQRDYSHLATVSEPRPWPPRPAGLPVLADPLGKGRPIDLAELDPDAPALSAIVIARNDVDRIEATLSSVLSQELEEPFEVILAASGEDGTRELAAERFPSVRVVRVSEPGLPGAARNAGLALARGEVVSFPGSHVELRPGSLAARLRAHRLGHGMVTGSIVNGNDTPAGWASYFLDHSRALPGRPSGPLAGPPAHCSYLRDALVEVGGFPEDARAGEDTVVNRLLWNRGWSAYRAQELELVHRSPCSTTARLLRHHLTRGRAYGRILVSGQATRATLLRLLRRYPRRRMRTTAHAAHLWGGELTGEFERRRGLIALGVLAAGAGAALEVLRPSRRDGEFELLARQDFDSPVARGEI